MEKVKIVTTSWDDGDYADLRVAELLQSRGVAGTFYVPINYRMRPLDPAQVRSLASAGFEVGAHGFSHKLLCGLPPAQLIEEIGPCRPILEDITGREVRMFSYPGGRYDVRVVRAVREAGYWGARTVRMLATLPSSHPFEMPTTLQVFPHPRLTYLKHVARERTLESVQTCLLQMPRLGSWLDLAKRLFDQVLERGGIWHLCGHSWEVERLGLWAGLCEILDYVSRRDDVSYVQNCALVPASTNYSALSQYNRTEGISPRALE